MKTLIASPFENDAAEILEWGYGRPAKMLFNEFVSMGQRAGQAFMNVLHRFDFNSYTRLTGSLADPFYNDYKLGHAIDKLTSK